MTPDSDHCFIFTLSISQVRRSRSLFSVQDHRKKTLQRWWVRPRVRAFRF